MEQTSAHGPLKHGETAFPKSLMMPVSCLGMAAAAAGMSAVVLLVREALLPALAAVALCAVLSATLAMIVRFARRQPGALVDLDLIEKSHRLATMSHELRTPLNGIIGMLSLLGETQLSQHQRNFAKTAQSSARMLLSTVDEFLNTAKAETQGDNKVLLDPVALVESVTELLAPRAHAKGIEISSRVAASVPREIIAHELSLRQILFNLAGNAIKFTDKGGVAIALTMPDQCKLKIEVKDTGIGLTADEQARLFQPFVQANEQTERKFGGTGLGLAITRRLVEEAGGSISVASQAGKGAVFAVTLPVKPILSLDVPQHTLAGRTYHLAMPEGFARAHLAETLAELGAEVGFIETKLALARALRSSRPLQHFICSSDYFGSLRKWAKGAQRGQSHVWIMLKAEERQSHADLLKSPFAGYLLNPLRRSTLLARLASADGRTLKQTGAKLRKASAHSETPALQPLSVLLAEDNAVNALLSRTHLQRMGFKVTHVADGAAALHALAGPDVFDIALLDMEMPHLSGLNVAKALRHQPGFSHRRSLPLLALTANARPEDLRACLAAGMDDHLAKPYDRLDLEDKIVSLAKGKADAA